MTKEEKLKAGAKISLIVLSALIIANLIDIYQTRYQIVSPLISEDVIYLIIKPFIFNALVFSIASLVALLLYFYKRYVWVIILSLLAIVFQEIYPYLQTWKN